MRDFSGVKY